MPSPVGSLQAALAGCKPQSEKPIIALFTFRVGTAEVECILVTVVCLSLAAFPHYCMYPDVTWGMVGVLSSCALLGRFAIGALVSLL